MRSLLRATLVSPWQQDETLSSDDMPSVWAAYVKELSHIIEIGLPDFWHAPQVLPLSSPLLDPQCHICLLFAESDMHSDS